MQLLTSDNLGQWFALFIPAACGGYIRVQQKAVRAMTEMTVRCQDDYEVLRKVGRGKYSEARAVRKRLRFTMRMVIRRPTNMGTEAGKPLEIQRAPEK